MKISIHARAIAATALLFSAAIYPTRACTNLIVTRGASRDASVMVTYAADSHTRYGYLFFYPAKDHAAGSMVDIYHYETGKHSGQIPEVAHTYGVVGFMNEHQVAIGETTFGGLDSLQSQPGSFLDYGSLMKLALQRARTAREAIRVIAGLMEAHGYASHGESLSISDAREAWIMEIIGKGRYGKGAVWVAMQVPDGYVSGHANLARITTFPFQKANRWEHPGQACFHSGDVIAFARARGYYSGKDEDFSFSDVYNPVDFGGARFCDARVWAFFRQVNREVRENPYYTEYALGQTRRAAAYPDGRPNPGGFVTNRLPLWVKPDEPLGLREVMHSMRDHFEGSPLSMTDGLGAGPFALPYRWRPMEFQVDSLTYIHERAIATQQTGYVFVAQSRSWLPDPLGGIFWFGVDDADGCVFAPMYCAINQVPEPYRQGNGSMIRWSDNSAFWVFNLVNNWAYTRYNMIHPEIEAYQDELEERYLVETAALEKELLPLFPAQAELAREKITAYSVTTANELVSAWKDFFTYLFMKYVDGNLKKSSQRKLLDNGHGREVPQRPTHPGYGKDWERKMMENTGGRYLKK